MQSFTLTPTVSHIKKERVTPSIKPPFLSLSSSCTSLIFMLTLLLLLPFFFLFLSSQPLSPSLKCSLTPSRPACHQLTPLPTPSPSISLLSSSSSLFFALSLPQRAVTVNSSCPRCDISPRVWSSCRLRPNSPRRSCSPFIGASKM